MSSQITDLYPPLSGFEGYSLAVAGWIHRVYPQWLQHVIVETFNAAIYAPSSG